MKKYLFLLFVLVGVLSSCEDESKTTDNIFADDEDLVMAIQDADNKLAITKDELHYEARVTLRDEYAGNLFEEAALAPDLGYEVILLEKSGISVENGGKERDGERLYLYFNMRGKRLGHGAIKRNGACFSFVFPITYIMPDNEETKVTGENMKELEKAIKYWYVKNKDYDGRPVLKFPVEVKFRGEVHTIKGEAGLKRIRMACAGDKDGDKDDLPCIEMVYPISYLLPSGRTLTAESGKELRGLMTKWKENNPDSRKKPSLVYPVDIKFNGKELTIKSEKEMMRVRNACKGEGK